MTIGIKIMKFLKTLFKKRKAAPVVDKAETLATSPANKTETVAVYSEDHAAKDKNLIKAYDKLGREIFITRDQWVDGILLGSIKDNWDKPQELYSTVLMAVEDGFYEYVVDAAKHLFEIDPNIERGACMCAIVLMKNELLDDAEVVLKQALTQLPDSGILMTNLAKVYADKDLNEFAEETLLKGLGLDPNQDNGLSWYLAISRERGGHKAYHAALLEVAEFSGAWRPQLWLARECLETGDKESALKYYAHCLDIVSQPSSDLLMQISGDLGRNGHIAEIIYLVLPVYVVKQHGFDVANNLIKAFIELERYQEAKRLVDSLFALNRPDWKKGLSFWHDEIDQKIKSYGPIDPQDAPVISTLMISPPCWLYGNKKKDELLNEKPNAAFKLLTISASCTRKAESGSEAGEVMKITKADREGSLCRGFPLAICDSLNLNSTCSATLFVPSVKNGGLVFLTTEHSGDDALDLSKQFSCDLIMLPHLIATDDHWVMKLKLFKPGQAEAVAVLSTTFEPDHPEQKLADLSLKLKQYLEFHYKIEPQSSITQLEQLPVNLYGHYIANNDTCLSILHAANSDNGGDTLYGERHIFDRLLDIAVDEQGSHVFKLMFIWALMKNREYGSDIYSEYQEKVDYFMQTIKCSDEVRAVLEEMQGNLYFKKA